MQSNSKSQLSLIMLTNQTLVKKIKNCKLHTKFVFDKSFQFI